MELRDCLNFLVVHTNQQTPDSQHNKKSDEEE